MGDLVVGPGEPAPTGPTLIQPSTNPHPTLLDFLFGLPCLCLFLLWDEVSTSPQARNATPTALQPIQAHNSGLPLCNA